MADEWRDPEVREGELDTLTTYLTALRQAVVRKVEGLDSEAAARPMVPSGTSLTGLIRHLSDVESYWFRFVFAAERDIEFYGFGENGAFAAEGVDVDDALARYAEVNAATDAIVAAADGVDALAAREHGGQVPTLRWVLHVMDETARHAGHADILREMIDGGLGR